MKNILITGVSSGIGYSTAKLFLDKGFRVFGSVRKKEDVEKLKTALGGNFFPLIFDVVDQVAINKAVIEVEGVLGGASLHCLVNNAGVSVNGPLAYIPVEEFSNQLDINVLGVLRVTQAFLPLLGFNTNKEKGRIINISSGSGRVTRPFMAPYSASKYAVEAISDGLRRELLDFGINVTVIEPGPIKSEIWSKAKADASTQVNKYKGTPYEKIYDNMDKAVQGMESIALDASKVSDLIYGIFEGKKKKTRYLVAPKKWLFWLAIHVFPDKFLDKMFQKQFKKLVEEK
ncbi:MULTISPECIES: SDR family oxidoreductase [Galbibacter]|uniref:SDR family oxidoreductase n=1 Tax=Galbibacter pacificus TaxID=2996052 RepID=A0ABT6FQV4_9FLAO|nr:SDR family oxidoreductase [Galbibacter pacificus]MDG3581916.1 SDR family oxidoreductase [Galbibacter pacificus]MDG3585610.1 SDR family oxidoreductase [Galbibacter pacificus]